jgi:Do/DeqQ family serine protease
MKRTLVLLSVSLVSGLAAWSPARAAIPLPFVSQETPSLAPMLKQALPAVVNISTTSKAVAETNPLMNDPFFRHFFREFDLQPQQQEEAPSQRAQSIGSGVILDAAKGYVITNSHVIGGADEVFVTLKDKRRFKAKVIGSDEETDVAVLQIVAPNLVALPIANSDKAEVGDFVLAIGSPFGLGHTVTSGIVSALGRSGLGIEGYEDFIQTDASINPGNSGGALINFKGELIGINTAIFAPSGGNVGIGFAIPVNMVREVMQQLITHGEIKRGQLGVHIQNVTPELAEAMKLPSQEGALVAKVEAGSAAEKAGIQEGDVITHFNGKPVEDASELRNKVGLSPLNSTVQLLLLRDGKPLKATVGVRAGAKDENRALKGIPLLEGAKFSPIPKDHPLSGKAKGVMVYDLDPQSPAAQAGLRPGDVVISVNRKKVTNVEELQAAAALNKKGILMNLLRGNMALYIVIQ